MRKLLPLFGVAWLLSGCVVYPNGAVGLAPVAVAPPIYAPAPYYGYGYGHRPYFAGGYGRGWGYRRW